MAHRHTMRLRSDLPARWRGPSGFGEARVLDISAGGLLLSGVAGLAPGDHVKVTVDLPDARVNLGGEVRFVGDTRHGPGCGVELLPRGADEDRWAEHYRRIAEHLIGRVPRSLQRYLRRRTGSAAG